MYLVSNTSPYRLFLGTYGDVKRRDCAFCRLVVDEPRFGVKSFQLEGVFDSDLVLAKSSLSHPWSNWSQAGQRGFLDFFILPIWICRRGIGVACSVIHAVEGRDRPIVPPLLSGRLIPPRYDAATVRAWLDDCAASVHDQPLDRSNAWKYIERFIDTEDECLVEAASRLHGEARFAERGYEFAALSYVWGRAGQQTTLTKAIFPALHQTHALSVDGAQVSATIRDSIRLCRDIGIRYLWVDALCIVQDDPGKLRQIKNLHRIYQNASLTIIAAFGDGADAGLPGVRPDTTSPRQQALRIQGLKLVKESPHLDDRLAGVYWASRAWTFQEFLLSPRRLVCTESTWYFSCPQGVRSEDVVSPPHGSGMAYHGSLERSGFNMQLRDKLNWSTYAELASSYTRRDLTKDADRIAAFLALSSVVAESLFEGVPFVFGLPSACLDAALLWRRCLGCQVCHNAGRGLERRGCFQDVPRDPTELPPSWSWAGWKGHVQYSKFILADENPSWSVVPRVNWLVAVENPGNTRSTAEDQDANSPSSGIPTWPEPRLIDRSIWKERNGGFALGDEGSIIYSHPIDASRFAGRQLTHLATGYLRLEAEVATFSVVGRLFSNMTNVRETGSYILNGTVIHGARIGDPLAIVEPGGSAHCGVLYDDLGGDDPAALGTGLPITLSFVKLSQTTLQETYRSTFPAALNQLTPGVAVRDYPEDDRKMLPNKLNRYFDYERYDYENLWCVYNVLAVRWDGDVAFRLGVGKIHADAFDAAPDLTRKRLWLG